MIASFDSYYIVIIQEKDAWSICDFVVSNEDRLKRFFPQTLYQNLTPNLAKSFAAKKVKQSLANEEFVYLLKEKGSHQLVGIIYIKELDWEIKRGEFAYCIGYQFEEKGLTTKAVRLLSEYAFKTLGLKTLRIIVNESNISSIKVATNNNFTWKETLLKEYTPPGEDTLDMELYELYNEK